jgi:hypothetical protein
VGPDGLSRFEELHRREAADTAILYACDLIERDGEDLRISHSSTARTRWRAFCAIPKLASCSTSTSPRRPVYVANCLADEQLLPSSEENGEPLTALGE